MASVKMAASSSEIATIRSVNDEGFESQVAMEWQLAPKGRVAARAVRARPFRSRSIDCI
jgi:hypothetical protein